jgi:hypothetical protein
MSLPKPRPEDYKTRAEYRWAKRAWRKRYGGWGSVFGSLLVFLLIAGLTRSAVFAFVALWVMLAWPIWQGIKQDQEGGK